MKVAKKKWNKPGPEYGVWSAMKDRCFNTNCNHYYNYGGPGISVCDRWLKFANFIEDMGKRPTAKHTLDRIDNDGNYEPRNCRWTTRAINLRNKRNNVMISYNGKEQCLMDWSIETGIKYFTLRARLRRGQPLFAPITPWIENLKPKQLSFP